jgi:serine/threonine-protein phosphatase 2A regulatory subunit B
MTGSYHNYFRIYDVNSDNDVVLQADKSAFKAKKIGGARGKVPGKKEGMQTEGIDFAKKIVSTRVPIIHAPPAAVCSSVC